MANCSCKNPLIATIERNAEIRAEEVNLVAVSLYSKEAENEWRKPSEEALSPANLSAGLSQPEHAWLEDEYSS